MKSKRIVLSIVGLTAILCIALFSFYSNNKNTATPKDITFTSIVLKGQSFYAFIPQKYFKKEFTITDATGRKLDPAFEWQDESILKISSLNVGNYTLTVLKNSGSSKSKKVEFSVKDIPEQAQNKQQLQDYFQSVKELKAVLATPFSVSKGGFFEGFAIEESANKDTASGSAPTSSADHSETNNQVAGIEEGDVAVTDGNYLYIVRDADVIIVKPTPLEQVAKLTFEESIYIEKLFAHNNFLIIQYVNYSDAESKTSVNVYNIANPAKPELVHTFTQQGHAIDSRIFNDQLFLLSNYYVIDENEVVPSTTTDGESDFIATKDIYIYPYTMSEEYTVISKINLASFDVSTKAFLGAGGNLYMSEHAIYMAAVEWQAMPFMTMIEPATSDRAMPVMNDAGETTILKYTFENDIEKVAETKIKGTVLNQFSMDEYNGFFRVAATAGSASLNDPARNSENLLYILDANLQEVGKVDNLARGERIYSVRFMGDQAYIVTFVETDPLFVLDLQDPQNPIVKGELKIPGYSNYLHPIGENHLLGIGHETIVRNDGKNKFVENLGVKLSLFNVTDPTNPIEQDVEVIGGAGTSSSVNYSHKGLYRDLTNNRFGFDINIYNGYVYEGVGAAFSEITPEGISNPQLFIEKETGEQYEDWNKVVKRILYVDSRTFIITNQEIKSLDRETLKSVESMILQ